VYAPRFIAPSVLCKVTIEEIITTRTVRWLCGTRFRHQEFIRFLDTIEVEITAGKIVHVILDNWGNHKHPKVRAWLDRHPRFMFYYTPTSASRLNAVEGFFAKLTKRCLKRGVFRSLVDLQPPSGASLPRPTTLPGPSSGSRTPI
jgi:hypothetical protein